MLADRRVTGRRGCAGEGLAWSLLAAVVLVGCSDGPLGPGGGRAPEIQSVALVANPHNVLSAVVSARLLHSDSAAVRLRVADEPSEIERHSAAVRVAGDSASIPVLGLLPAARYDLQVIAWGRGKQRVGEALEFVTSPLPADLPLFRGEGPDASPSYTVFAADGVGIVVDHHGRIVWYRKFVGGSGLTFAAQPNGRYYARPPTPEEGDIEPWLELDPLGNVTATISCALGLQPRFHDLIAQADGTFWLLCDENRTLDLTEHGGHSAARVTGTSIQQVARDGSLLFHWSPFDHLAITDLDPAERTGPTVNWTHGNSLDLDRDGHLLVSFRNLGEITKIHTSDGTVLWRLGGLANQFLFVDTPVPAFARQHSVRASGRGLIVMLDNSGDPTEARAEHFAIDGVGRTARLVRSYGAEPKAETPFGGSVQNLPGGRTLVSFGMASRVAEYDGEGRTVWSLVGSSTYIFRAQRIESLYAPGVGSGR